MNLNDLFNEEKVRLDPKCWKGKKIGNPKTKMKGGVRVNNCVPAESVEQGVAEGSEDLTPIWQAGKEAAYKGKSMSSCPYKMFSREYNAWQQGWQDQKESSGQGVAEATGDQKFDTMMSRITAEPKYPDRQMPPTSIPELIQWADQNNKPYHKFFAQWAQKHRFTNVNDALIWFGDNVDPYDEFGPKDHENDFGDLVGEPLIDAAKHNPKAAELLKAFKCYEEIIDDWDDEYRQMNLPENQLDEKSVSQAQFRTMAAAAHNPKFAKKVGISQDVAREFNKADKGQDYKKLPARTTEESERGRGRPTTGEWDPTSGKVGRTEKTPTGIRHHADPSRYGGTEPDPEFDTLNKNTINAMDRALGVKWDRESKKYFSPLKVDMDEGEQQKGADYRDPPEADYGDDYQDMVARVKKLAGLGPMKTVYDPNKRQYRNMPTAVQPKK